jgi:hypothetical protein
MDCDCGIYAAARPTTLAPYLDSSWPGRKSVDLALGRVRLWGTVIECERGWRGQHAYPDRLYLCLRSTSEESRRLADEMTTGLRDYCVPISLLRRAETLDAIAALAQAV